MTIKKPWPGMLLAGLLFSLSQTGIANPPRVLDTSFEQYAQQQQQHDQALTQKTGLHTATPATRNAVQPVQAAQTTQVKKTSSSKKSTTPININQADETSLVNTLIGVGPAKAKAIIAYRQQNGQFRQIDDLLQVKGIGPATLQKNRDRIRLD